MAGVAQRNPLFQRPHWMVVQVGDAIGAGVPVAQVADGVFRQGDAAGDVPPDNLPGQLGSDVAVEDAGPARFQHIQQGFGEAEAEGSHLRHVGVDTAFLQGGLDGLHHLKTASGLAGQSGADPDPGAVAVGQRLPAALRFGQDGVKLGVGLRSHVGLISVGLISHVSLNSHGD